MSAHQYPFIDLAVHERVRGPFARGEAVALFSTDMQSVLWANGRGAALFGYPSIYDFLDAPVPGDVVFRQLAAAARQLPHRGLGKSLLLRIGPGFRGLPVNAHVERITLADGEDAILFNTQTAPKDENATDRAASLLAGFDDPDTHMAVLDSDGGIVAASPGFSGLGISEDALRRMVDYARREADGLVKRPIPTGKGLLPSALGRVSIDPAMNLLFAVETILGHLDAEQDVVEAAASTQIAPVNEKKAEPATASKADTEALPSPADVAAKEGSAPSATSASASDLPPANDATEDLAAAASTIPEAASALNAEAAAESPMGSVEDELPFVFNRSSRPVRFVWKIDAEGVFSEISEEFAAVVGPHAAQVTGMPFADVARRYHFDADGTIGELLGRRDTWSGKTIYWPVEGTTLVVPVDLAALPTYSRNREFDGFRGFGIVRVADAIEDPDGRGLRLAGMAAPIDFDAEQPERTPDELSSDEDMLLTSTHPSEAEQPAVPSPSVLDELLAEETEAAALVPSEDEATVDPDDAFQGERPALRIVENPGRRQSDKIVQLDDRRNGNLTTGEQAAFREIARRLGESFGKRKPEDMPATTHDRDAAIVEQTNSLLASSAGAEGPAANANDEIVDPHRSPPSNVRDEAPGLDVGGHVDDMPAKAPAIVAPRTAMDYGLTSSIVDALPVALLVHVGDRLIHANPEFLDMTGFGSLSELAEAGGLDALLDRSDAEDAEKSGTMLLRHADGIQVLPVNARLQSVRWESGSALMLALSGASDPEAPSRSADTSTDIAAQAAESETDALRSEANELRSILETATDGVVVVGQDGEIRSLNRSASALFNYDDDEVRGKPFAMLFAHESQKAVIDYLAGLSGHGVASVLNDGREVIGREASGGFIPLFMTVGRLSSSGYCAVIRDITQWKRTEEDLRNAKRLAETANAHKSDFLARVSHEIRTPLNAIIGFSDMMAGERFGPIGHPRYVEYANDIGRSGRHVLDIVNDLLDISKIEAGEMELDFAAVGLNEGVSEAVALMQPQANSQRVIIRTSLSTAVPPIVADQRSIKQIAINILSNAIRFTPSGGQIVVSTSYETNGSVVLRIRDTGVGMTRSELEQAMKPFRQVTTGARKRGDGTGLGLPLTKAMVDANRANFSISSSPNEGTLVEITFPSQRVLAV